MRKKTHNLSRLSSAAIRQRLKRENETIEEREERRNKAKMYSAFRRANETPDERQRRLAAMKTNVKQITETIEQRTARLSQLAARKSVALSRETPVQKDMRLLRNRILLAARRASETPEKREKRLSRARIQKALERTYETPEQREQRLFRVRNQKAFKRASETPEQKRERLSRLKYLTALRRASKKDMNGDNQRQTVAQLIRDLCQNIDKECIPSTDALVQCINKFWSNDSMKILGFSDKVCEKCGTLKLKYISTDESSRVMETCVTCQSRTSKIKLTSNANTDVFQMYDPLDDDDDDDDTKYDIKDPLALPLVDIPSNVLTPKDYTVPFIDVIKVEPPEEVMVKTEPKCEENDDNEFRNLK